MNRPLPDAIANAPEISLGLELYYEAFLELHSCRGVGFGEGPIPWTSIIDYCEAFDIDGEQREDLIYHVTRLDKVYLDWTRKKSEVKEPSNGRLKKLR